MGLLDKARDSRSPDLGTGDLLLQKLEQLDQGVDYPVVLFQNLVNHYSVEKGALFFGSEEDGTFICLSSKGYDKTTANRLRLDKNSWNSAEFTDMHSRTASLMTSEPVHCLKEYMSSREYGLLDEIHWLPFFRGGRISALIIISQWMKTTPEDWEKTFNLISIRYSDSLYKSRKALVTQGDTVSRKTAQSEGVQRLNSIDSEEVYLIEIDISDLIQMLMELKEGLSMLNLKREIISVFRTMAGPEQELLDIDNERIIMILNRKRVPDKALFIHQLSASLPLLFQDLSEAPRLKTREIELPPGREEREEYIRALI